VFGKTQKELLPKFNKLKASYAGIELTEDSLITLGQWMDKWLDEHKSGIIRSTTMANYKNYSNNYIKPRLGSKKLTQITGKDIQEMYNKLKQGGRVNSNEKMGTVLSNATVRSVHMLLHEALDGAVREGLIPRNPTDGTTIPRLERTEKTVLLESQIEKFMKTIETTRSGTICSSWS
jgi:integrase